MTTSTAITLTVNVDGQSVESTGTLSAPVDLSTAQAFTGSLTFASNGASVSFTGTLPAEPPAFIPSPDGTIVKLGSSAVITDASGNTWGINSGAVITVNGTADTTTGRVVQIAFISGKIWQENTSNLWWEKTLPTDAWTPQAGTSVSPLPNASPPANDPITSPVFDNGVFAWAGDWSGNNGKLDYAFVAPGVNGPGPVIEWLAGNAPWQYWLPYPKSNPNGPAANGVNFPMAGLTYFTIAIKPTKAGGILTMGLYEANGAVTDIPFGNSVTITQAKYGQAVPVVGAWNVYKIPLADFSTAMPPYIYKFIIQEQGTMEQTYYLDQVGFY